MISAKVLRPLVFAAALAICLPAAGDDLSVAIFFTADIHGAIEAAGRPIEPGVGREPGGGLLRCATLIRTLREQSTNSILLDLGDLLQGSPAAFLTRGKAAIDGAASLGYDAFVLGNHDLEWGAEQAAALYSSTDVPLLAANLLPSENGAGLAPKPFVICHINGVKVAVVGLTTPWVPMWLPEKLLAGTRFEQSVQALRRIMPDVRAQKPDVLVLAAHQAYRPHGDDPASQLNAVALAFPDFDLILGAHSHQAVPDQRIHGVPYAQPGSHGAWVGKALVKLDAGSRRTIEVTTELFRVTPETQPDPSMAALLGPVMQQTLDLLSAPAGIADCEHRPDAWTAGSPSVPALIAEAMRRASGADVVLHGALSDAVLPRGPLTFSRLWSLIPYENSLVLASVTPSDLDLILKDAARLSGRQRRLAWGWDSGAAASPVAAASHPDGQEKRVLLAVNSFDACSAGGRLPALREVLQKPESKAMWLDLSTRQALENYTKSNSPFCVRVGR